MHILTHYKQLYHTNTLYHKNNESQQKNLVNFGHLKTIRLTILHSLFNKREVVVLSFALHFYEIVSRNPIAINNSVSLSDNFPSLYLFLWFLTHNPVLCPSSVS